VTQLSVPEDDTTPEVVADGLTIYFGSSRPGSIGADDVYVSERGSRGMPWGMPVRVAELATAERDVAPSAAPDRMTMLVGSNRAGTAGALDLWITTWLGTSWSAPSNLPDLNSASDDSGGCFDRVATTLVYWTARADGGEIWISHAPFTEGAPLTEVNSTSGDTDPWLSPDGRTLVFTSNRDGVDHLYIATR
jgi:hypothetical protein